jgi:hypothetical protein
MIKLRSFDLLRGLVLALLLTSAAPTLAAGPYQFFPLTPCRVVDTRGPDGVNGGPAVTAYQSRSFSIQGNCGVPLAAEAVTLNLTVVSPTEAGWLGIYPSATGFSGTSTVNFATGEFALANGAIVPVSATVNDVSVLWGNYSANVATTDVVIDVTGYFAP